MQKTEEQKMSRDEDFQSLNAALEKQEAAYEKAKEKMDAEAKKLKALQQKKRGESAETDPSCNAKQHQNLRRCDCVHYGRKGGIC